MDETEKKETESQQTQVSPSVSESKPADSAASTVVETTPEVKPAAKAAESDLSSALDQADDGLDLDEVEEIEGEDKTEKAEGETEPSGEKVEEAKPEAKPGEAAAAAAKPEGEVKPKPAETQVADADKPKPAETIPQAQNLEEVQEQFKKWRNESETLLAEHHYALPKEVVKEYEDEGVSPKLLQAIPRMMSRVYLDAVQATMGQIMTHLPTLMSQVTRARDESSQLESKFYEQWPKLKEKPEFADTIRRIGTAYRQINPRATADDFIREVGAGAMIALRLPVETSAASAQSSAGSPKSSFRPAAATRPASPKAAKPSNVFEELAEGDKVEELDLDN